MNGKKQRKSAKKGNMICKKMRVNGQMKKVCKPVGKAKNKKEALMRRMPKRTMTAQEGKKQVKPNRIIID
mgnify:CR=1 FL=1